MLHGNTPVRFTIFLMKSYSFLNGRQKACDNTQVANIYIKKKKEMAKSYKEPEALW